VLLECYRWQAAHPRQSLVLWTILQRRTSRHEITLSEEEVFDVSLAGPFGSTPVTTTPESPEPATSFADSTIRPRCGVLSSCLASSRACCSLGTCPRVTANVRSLRSQRLRVLEESSLQRRQSRIAQHFGIAVNGSACGSLKRHRCRKPVIHPYGRGLRSSGESVEVPVFPRIFDLAFYSIPVRTEKEQRKELLRMAARPRPPTSIAELRQWVTRFNATL
jgi:hypothetical protein